MGMETKNYSTDGLGIDAKIELMSDAVKDFIQKNSSEVAGLRDQVRALEKRAGRLGAGAESSKENEEHKTVFTGWMRHGREDGLAAIEAKALNIAAPADGGYAVPEDLDRELTGQLRNLSTIRQLANNVRSASPTRYRKLISVHGSAATWVGETSSRPETSSPKLAEIAPPGGELYANPSATQWMLDDAAFDAAEWLVNELADQFSLSEGAAFVSGDGTNKPKGFLTHTINTSSDGAREFGDLMMLKTGVAGDFIASTSSTNPVDSFISTVMSLAPGYRANATWVMNSATLERVRRFKDSDGNFIWRPGAERGQPSLLLGHPVLEDPNMPDVATNTYPIAFGDWQRGYTVVDHMAGTRLLRDPFTNKPYVHFYTTRRVSGGVGDSNAIRLLATRT